jgi:hypothetical protein
LTSLPGPAKGAWVSFWETIRKNTGEKVARRSQNAFLKRQKELKRLRKAREKMARRQGKNIDDLNTFEGPAPPAGAAPEPAEDAQSAAGKEEDGGQAEKNEAAG